MFNRNKKRIDKEIEEVRADLNKIKAEIKELEKIIKKEK